MVQSIIPLIAFLQLAGPVEAALNAADAPNTVRVAFQVELRSDDAAQIYAFDPRLEPGARWQLVRSKGEDAYLDEVAAAWANEPAPDGRLFPDDLRASIGETPEIARLGPAWRLQFKHEPSENDGLFDIWVAEQLEATAWLSPETGRFLRIDYELPKPVRLPEGGRLLRLNQSYILEPDPVYDLSLITAFSISLEARGGFKTERRTYSMQVRQMEVFFANPAAEMEFFVAERARKADALIEPR